MADVSAITALGDVVAPANPLDIATKLQALRNARTNNLLTQQEIRNSELTNRTGEQALASNMQSQFAQKLFAVNQLPDDQVADWAKTILQHGMQTGAIDQAHAGAFASVINSGDVGRIRTLANLGVIGNMHGPEALTAMIPHQELVDFGGQKQVVTQASPIDRLKNPTLQPQVGDSYPNTLSPGEQAGQATRPASQQDVEEFASHGVTILPGQAITETMRQRLQQQNSGDLLPQTGPRPISAPQRPVAPSVGVPPRTVPPMSSSGQPVSPASPARLQPTPAPAAQPQPTRPAAVITGQPPNQPAENAASAGLFGQEQAASSDFYVRDQQQGAALSSLRTAKTGPGTDTTNHWKSFFQAMAPDLSKAVGIDPNKITDFDTAKKYLTALATQAPGAAGSDLRTSLAQMSNPSTEISNRAAVHIMATIQGLSRMRQAAFQQFVKENAGADGSLSPGASQKFGSYMTKFGADHDYRAFTPMNEEEFKTAIKGMSAGERKRFNRSLDIAESHGF